MPRSFDRIFDDRVTQQLQQPPIDAGEHEHLRVHMQYGSRIFVHWVLETYASTASYSGLILPNDYCWW